ncbi:MAG TPA: hypothetical protein VER55_07770 [Ardenticatenaceae bacterium]|nr:hypothetical protein [Ardenticatenaceae bacterium]
MNGAHAGRRATGGRLALMIVPLVAALAVVLGSGSLASAQGTTTPSCQFVFGFAALADAVARAEGAERVGQCLENEIHTPNGDGFQRTTRGLLIWRKATNWTGFTDGQNTLLNGPAGLEQRPNSERLPWEGPPVRAATTFVCGSPEPLPPRADVEEAIRQVEVLHQANDGSTFNLYFGDLAGQSLYAVSLYPDRGIVLEGKSIPQSLLRSFVLSNQDLLRDPRLSVGTFFDSESNTTYLDVSATLADRQQAIELGQRYNQISIFDLGTFEEIPTGGTGTTIPNLPPAAERLPQCGYPAQRRWPPETRGWWSRPERGGW